MAEIAPYWPIIYVRGYAATMDEIEDTSADPYMGFNLGATKIRQNYKGQIVRFIFESPLLRLIKDEGYIDCYRNGDFLPRDESVPSKSVWIFRYYEQASEDLGEGHRQTIPEIAQDLRRFILRVRDSVCRDNPEMKSSFRVYLVAHSMGGLICRSYLQNLCVYGSGDANTDIDLQLAPLASPIVGGRDAVHLIDKVFTYATPHNGIDLLGMNAPNIGMFDAFHVRNFNRREMRRYLRLPIDTSDTDDVDSLNGAFPPERFFCLVGTNYNDYLAFFKLSRKGTGPMSDGLVMIKNATVKGAPRAFVFRSHSGHYGIVNSEEGYQNLRRFLFGDVRVELQLLVDDILLPNKIQKLKDEGRQIRASYNIETTARVRGGTYFMHERKVDQASAILAEYDEIVKEHKPLYLFTGYLLKSAKAKDATDTALAFAVQVTIQVPMYEVDREFWLDDHFEGGVVFDETITFFVRPGEEKTSVRYGLASERGIGEAGKPLDAVPQDDGSILMELPLGFKKDAVNPPRPGFTGKLRLVISPWNA